MIVPFAQVQAQENPFSQERTELNALQKYEQEHPPRQSMPMPAPAENEALFGSRLTRSVTLLATSTPEHRWPVKILIYGQSIVGSQIFTEQLAERLKEKFPFADITIENRSIGGFAGDRLLGTSVNDVTYACADLIIFHVYGGEKHGELEQIFSNIRKNTTADVLLLGHHMVNNEKMLFPESFDSFQYLRYIANKYNLEWVDVSKEWLRYLLDNNFKRNDLLRDYVHPNRAGNLLLSRLVVRHLNYNYLFPSDWYKTVQTYYVSEAYDKDSPFVFGKWRWKMLDTIPCGDSPKDTLKFSFSGNRIDLIAGHLWSKEKLGSASIRIDGKPVSEHNLYAITRPSPGPKTWWPAIRRVSNVKPLIAEDWTLKVDKVNADSTIYYYSVKGTKTGVDGSGNTAERFVSKSGRVVIEPDNFMFSEINKGFHGEVPVGFTVTWSVKPLFKEIYQSPATSDRAKVYKTTVVQGMKNGSHTLEIIPNGDGVVPIEAIEVHRPPRL